jgi:hypothetical protein
VIDAVLTSQGSGYSSVPALASTMERRQTCAMPTSFRPPTPISPVPMRA